MHNPGGQTALRQPKYECKYEPKYQHIKSNQSDQGRIQEGAAGLAGLPNGNWHPCARAQGCQFSSPSAEYLSPLPIFASKKLYVSLPDGQGAHLIGKGTAFAHDNALLGRYDAPPASRGTFLA